MIKKYVLKIYWNAKDDVVEHLEEQFSDVEVYSFEVFGKSIPITLELENWLRKNNVDVLGVT